jgi:hypothetical protein
MFGNKNKEKKVKYRTIPDWQIYLIQRYWERYAEAIKRPVLVCFG